MLFKLSRNYLTYKHWYCSWCQESLTNYSSYQIKRFATTLWQKWVGNLQNDYQQLEIQWKLKWNNFNNLRLHKICWTKFVFLLLTSFGFRVKIYNCFLNQTTKGYNLIHVKLYTYFNLIQINKRKELLLLYPKISHKEHNCIYEWL